MLVLSRKINERIIINGNIVITIADIDRGKVRVGIDAPKHITVIREELLSFDEQKALKEAQQHDLGGEA